MVADQPVVEFQQLWFPTRASGERFLLMNLEIGLNQIAKRDELSVAEVAWSTGDVEEALSSLPSIVPEETRGRMKRLLQPWPGGHRLLPLRATETKATGSRGGGPPGPTLRKIGA